MGASRKGKSAFGWLSRDGKILLTTKILRTLSFGYLSVALSYYFGSGVLNLSAFVIGIIGATALLGGAAFTLIGGFASNTLGRRNSLTLFGLLVVVSGTLLVISTSIITVLIAIFIGSIGVNATEIGPFVSVEQAIMPQTVDDNHRTYAFSTYNLLGYAGAAFGSLLSTFPSFSTSVWGLTPIDGYRILFALYAAGGLIQIILYRSLSGRVEVKSNKANSRSFSLKKSRRIVGQISALFAVDAFAGAFVIQLILSQWYQTKFGALLPEAGAIFFFSQLITAASFLVAGRLAKRIGLLNTMVFTHIPSNLLLIGVALAPTFQTSVAFLYARQSLSQMDVPTRQSYLVAIVDPEERNAATSVTNASRTIATVLPPSISGYFIGASLFAAPFILAGTLKIAYDLMIFASFRKVKPPEEKQLSSRSQGHAS